VRVLAASGKERASCARVTASPVPPDEESASRSARGRRWGRCRHAPSDQEGSWSGGFVRVLNPSFCKNCSRGSPLRWARIEFHRDISPKRSVFIPCDYLCVRRVHLVTLRHSVFRPHIRIRVPRLSAALQNDTVFPCSGVTLTGASHRAAAHTDPSIRCRCQKISRYKTKRMTSRGK
jgi:hypothetical protein